MEFNCFFKPFATVIIILIKLNCWQLEDQCTFFCLCSCKIVFSLCKSAVCMLHPGEGRLAAASLSCSSPVSVTLSHYWTSLWDWFEMRAAVTLPLRRLPELCSSNIQLLAFCQSLVGFYKLHVVAARCYAWPRAVIICCWISAFAFLMYF